MVPFAGYEMPVQYPGGIIAEHQAVRTGVGMFDVSHMGEFEVTGPDRNAFLNRVTCNDVSRGRIGGVQYSGILTPEGTFVDDCTLYRFDDKWMIVVNASNIAAAWEHFVDHKGGAQHPAQGHLGRRRAARAPGPRRRGAAPAAHPGAPGRHRLLPLRRRRGRGGGLLHLAHRLHRRGRLRAVLPGPERRHPLERAHHGRRDADRARRARLAAARDGLRALRPRDRRTITPLEAGLALDREARQGRPVRRAMPRSGRRSSAGSPASWSASGWRGGASRGRARRCGTRAAGGRGPERRHEPVARHADRHDVSAGRGGGAGHPASRWRAGASGCRPRS